MTKLVTLGLATAFAAATLAPGMAAACMKNSVSASSSTVTTTTIVDGTGSLKITPATAPTTETKTGG